MHKHRVFCFCHNCGEPTSPHNRWYCGHCRRTQSVIYRGVPPMTDLPGRVAGVLVGRKQEADTEGA